MADVQTMPNQDSYATNITEGSFNQDMFTEYDPIAYVPLPLSGIAPTPMLIHEPTPTPDFTTANDPYLRLDRYTPDTDVGNIPSEPRPDISLYCKLCSKHITLKLLLEHRMYHKALETMHYRGDSFPESVQLLKQRRSSLLKKLHSKSCPDNTINPSQLQRLNDAYEFLKSDLDDTFDGYRRVIENPDTQVQGLALNCSTPCAPAVSICSHGNERWKSAMEDTRVFQDYFGNDPKKCFFALYDGHNGRFTADVAANELHHFLLLEMEKFDPRTKCTCTFNMADNYDISEYNLEEVHSRPTSRYTERGVIHEESTNVIQQIIRTCEERLSSVDQQSITTTEKDYDESSENPQTESEKPTISTTKDEKDKKKKDMNPFAEKMAYAFKKAHKHTDYLLSYGKDEMSRVRWSGCSTLACIIQDTQSTDVNNDTRSQGQGQNASMPANTLSHLEVSSASSGHSRKTLNSANSRSTSAKTTMEPPRELGVIYLANAGNSHAVLVRADRAYRLTRNHTPHNTKEGNRILKAGGSVNEGGKDLRVNGVLSTTRGLGNHGDPGLKRCVITEPYTTSVQIDQYAQFIILATNGVWEVFSEYEAASLLLQMLPANHVPPPSRLSTSLNFIYGVTETTSNNELQSQYSGASSDVTDIQPTKNIKAEKHESQKQVFGNLKSKSNVRINEESNIYVQKEMVSGQAGSIPNVKVNSASTIHELLNDDMQTEIGSQVESVAGDSGNEADVETDFVTLSSPSRLSGKLASPEDKQREFAKVMSERLVQAALLAGAKDNITVMVILLSAAGV